MDTVEKQRQDTSSKHKHLSPVSSSAENVCLIQRSKAAHRGPGAESRAGKRPRRSRWGHAGAGAGASLEVGPRGPGMTRGAAREQAQGPRRQRGMRVSGKPHLMREKQVPVGAA
jgi:hypothetical protein